jgi:hypothetical protein
MSQDQKNSSAPSGVSDRSDGPLPVGRASASALDQLGSEAAHTDISAAPERGREEDRADGSASIVASSPASFFSSSLSSTDSAFHRIAVLLCPGCAYLEFPGCLMHSGLLANIKGY